jgi:pimeloyl-ACP methyl ester carboxylesterase
LLRVFGELSGGGCFGRRHCSAVAVQIRSRRRVAVSSYIAVLLLAAGLTGCGGYSAFDPESTSAVSFSGGSSSVPRPGPAVAPSDRRDAATLDTLFAGAAQDRTDDGTAIRPTAVASAADIAPQPAPPPDKDIAEPRGRAYLFRGVAGLIYSRGMDSLADRIRHAGVPTSVQTYLLWRSAVEQAIQDYRRDPAPIVVIGHSMGGDSALAFAQRLNSENIPVSLLVTYDPTRIADDVPPNVERYINIYQSSNFMGGGNVVQATRFHGHYASFNLKDHSEIIHINIEKAERIQQQLVRKIAELSSTPAAAQGEAVPLHLEVPADAAIELWDSGVPVQAHAGDTLKSMAAAYHVPSWSLAEINAMSVRAPLSEGQRVIVPRHLVPMTIPSTITSYVTSGH